MAASPAKITNHRSISFSSAACRYHRQGSAKSFWAAADISGPMDEHESSQHPFPDSALTWLAGPVDPHPPWKWRSKWKRAAGRLLFLTASHSPKNGTRWLLLNLVEAVLFPPELGAGYSGERRQTADSTLLLLSLGVKCSTTLPQRKTAIAPFLGYL